MKHKKKAMPIGIEDFEELISRDYYFVDKTRFIKELLDSKGKVVLITRPRRFGKTLALSMLQHFFDIEHAEENRNLFAGLEIERAGEDYMAEQGTRPIIFLTLKGVRGEHWDNASDKLALVLSKLYRSFLFLLDSPSMTEVDRDFFHSVWKRQCSEAELENALSNLSESLERHYGRKPVLLLDEYDAPILSAWENGYYDQCIRFMREFLGNALKTNFCLDFAVLTGVTRVSKESIFSGLNNLHVCSVLSEIFSDSFGFTQEEAAKLMKDCGMEDQLPSLKSWYDGYQFGEKEIYNPWSVVNFVNNKCKFQPYWINVSGNSILKDLVQRVDTRRQKELEGLLQGHSVDAPVLENIIYPDIQTNRDALFMMLLTTGYLKPVKHWQDSGYREWASLKIPNVEVRLAYEREILVHIAPSQGETLLRDMLDAMTVGNASGFSEHLSELLRDFVSFHDAAQPESFYHGLMLGFSVLMEGTYRVESNRESGYGRFDIAFFPRKENSPGVILELKATASEQEMERVAKEALRQIEKKSYVTELARQGVKDVWKYGIAFHGKKVLMERS